MIVMGSKQFYKFTEKSVKELAFSLKKCKKDKISFKCTKCSIQ